tara:strand:+ start:1245 stop:1439 length:195 start_codon:yes stop_codon:yes gene_type:complete
MREGETMKILILLSMLILSFGVLAQESTSPPPDELASVDCGGRSAEGPEIEGDPENPGSRVVPE